LPMWVFDGNGFTMALSRCLNRNRGKAVEGNGCDGIQRTGNVAGITVANIRGPFAVPDDTPIRATGFRDETLSRVRRPVRGLNLSALMFPAGDFCLAGRRWTSSRAAMTSANDPIVAIYNSRPIGLYLYP
jgi:hypothetical protein